MRSLTGRFAALSSGFAHMCGACRFPYQRVRNPAPRPRIPQKCDQLSCVLCLMSIISCCLQSQVHSEGFSKVILLRRHISSIGNIIIISIIIIIIIIIITTSSNKITDHCHIRSYLGSRYRLCSWMGHGFVGESP